MIRKIIECVIEGICFLLLAELAVFILEGFGII